MTKDEKETRQIVLAVEAALPDAARKLFNRLCAIAAQRVRETPNAKQVLRMLSQDAQDSEIFGTPADLALAVNVLVAYGCVGTYGGLTEKGRQVLELLEAS